MSDLNSIKEDMRANMDFEEVFAKELQSCYEKASQANEAGDDRAVQFNLSQALVWKRLLKIATFTK